MSDQFKRSVTSRTGRKNQVYTQEGARIVSGCVCLTKDHKQVLLISSSKHKDRWIIPKGGVENDEKNDFSLTAKRETWEEAGCTGEIIKKLDIIEDMRPSNEWANITKEEFSNTQGTILTKIPKTEYHFYELEINELINEYPESKQRNRRLVNFHEAHKELKNANRPELLRALEISSIDKTL
ncbi:hypothetical protein TBLA_0E03250 [Henningerozyma blattae CBS 6284]|uniref:Nudix hydrolase domain-containing protein n=1 Tax=Henningerozyma blattae (strain ATCC 34711 / CBS 6284 / DSM 70876 / NBRC 10599 / NRRL Y-10934 / UCD 77-7) TaxID=1071380 RepID=I2H4S7_HENB6|nr:hypothetical protein TBLA_0E03250 [Tetrapisispora blattae CBS 6284]CCH61379.1 hypothetical protein TBLA_0E03250 [Tetrapisispora blattae CBS 6284]